MLLFGRDQLHHRRVVAPWPAGVRIGRYPAVGAFIGSLGVVEDVVAVAVANQRKTRGVTGRFDIGRKLQIPNQRVAVAALQQGVPQLVGGAESGKLLKGINAGGQSEVVASGLQGPLLGVAQVLVAGGVATILLGKPVEVQPPAILLVFGVKSGQRAQITLVGIFKFYDDPAVFGDELPVGKHHLAAVVVNDVIGFEAAREELAVYPHFFCSGQYDDEALAGVAVEFVRPLIAFLLGDGIACKLSPRNGHAGRCLHLTLFAGFKCRAEGSALEFFKIVDKIAVRTP